MQLGMGPMHTTMVPWGQVHADGLSLVDLICLASNHYPCIMSLTIQHVSMQPFQHMLDHQATYLELPPNSHYQRACTIAMHLTTSSQAWSCSRVPCPCPCPAAMAALTVRSCACCWRALRVVRHTSSLRWGDAGVCVWG